MLLFPMLPDISKNSRMELTADLTPTEAVGMVMPVWANKDSFILRSLSYNISTQYQFIL